MRIVSAALILGLLVGFSVAQSPSSSSSGSKTPWPDKIGGKGLEEWKKQLSSEDASKRDEAIVAIVQFGEAASICVPAIVARLKDTDVSPRASALVALRTMSVDDKDVEAVVVAVAGKLHSVNPQIPTRDTQSVIRYEATLTLSRFVPVASSAVPALIGATMDTSSWKIRHNAVSLLWRISVATNKDGTSPDPRVINALLAAIEK